jgi:hypothetical protein
MIMRLSLGVLVCLGMSALCAACADKPTKASSAAAVPAVAPAPAAPVAQAATVADTDQDRHFRAMGYSLKMHDGDKLWCRREESLGSRVGGKLFCSTPEQLRQIEQQAKDTAESVQRNSRTGCLKPCS